MKLELESALREMSLWYKS